MSAYAYQKAVSLVLAGMLAVIRAAIAAEVELARRGG